MLVPTANKLLFISIALQLYGSNSVKALPPGLDSIHDLRSSLRVRLEPILPLPKPEIPPAPKVPEPAAPVPPSAPGPHVGNPESPPEIPGLVPGRPGSAPPRAPDPAPEGNAGSGCEATKRGLVIRCAGWDKAHDGFVDDAQKRPGVQDDKTLLDLYKSQGKLGTQPIKSGHLDEVKTKYAKGYRTEEDKSDNSLTTGHSEESRIKGLLDQLDIKDVIEKVDFSDFKTYAKLRPKEDSGASPGFSEDYTARNKIGAGDNDVIVLAEENYAKKDTNRFLSDKDNKETQDDVNRAQALYNYDLAMMQMGEKLGGDFNGLGKKFVYHVRANIDNDNTVSSLRIRNPKRPCILKLARTHSFSVSSGIERSILMARLL